MRQTLATFIGLAALLPAAAFADVERLQAEGSVAEVADRLEASVEAAGATVFARIDHAAGAQEAGMELADAQLVIFGNPALGTPAMQDDMRAGLHLPLKMLIYAADDGATQIIWEEPEDSFGELDIDDDAAYIEKMEAALERFAGAAAKP